MKLVDSRGRPRVGNRRPQRAGTIAEPRPGYFVVRVRAGVDENGRELVRRRAGRVERSVAEAWLVEMGATPYAPPEPVERAPRRVATPTVPAGPCFSLAPLLGTLRARAVIAETGEARVLADLVDVSTNTARRWLERGWLDVDRADEVATALGRHPAEVWPEWVDLLADAA